ncbi:MAG: GDSL-type esterase/lipase family protein [Ilumatobacteraceae bacterium]
MPPTSPLPLSTRRQVLTAGLLAAFGSIAAVELLGDASASAASTRATASRVSVVGDSLTIGTLPFQADAFTTTGWGQSTVDAYGSRGIRTKIKKDPHTGLTAVDAIKAKSGDSDLWVVALGTNDAGIYATAKHPTLIRMMMDQIGIGHKVMWVNVYLPGTPERQDHWNAALATVAEERSDDMIVFDWAAVAAENPQWFAHDQIHCSNKGYRERATAIAEATKGFVRVERVERSWVRPCLPGSKSHAA